MSTIPLCSCHLLIQSMAACMAPFRAPHCPCFCPDMCFWYFWPGFCILLVGSQVPVHCLRSVHIDSWTEVHGYSAWFPTCARCTCVHTNIFVSSTSQGRKTHSNTNFQAHCAQMLATLTHSHTGACSCKTAWTYCVQCCCNTMTFILAAAGHQGP